MKTDDPQSFVCSTLGLRVYYVELDRKLYSSTTYNPFFSPILVVPFLCTIHATHDGRVIPIVSIRSGTRTSWPWLIPRMMFIHLLWKSFSYSYNLRTALSNLSFVGASFLVRELTARSRAVSQATSTLTGTSRS